MYENTDHSVVMARLTAISLAAAADPIIEFEKIAFLSRWVHSRKVTLTEGEYREPAAPGPAKEIVGVLYRGLKKK